MSNNVLTEQDYYDNGGAVGDATAAQVMRGLAIAWRQAENYLNANMLVATGTYTAVWPSDGNMDLDKGYLTGLVSVTARHDLSTCTCQTQDFSECAIIVDQRTGVISLRSCHSSLGSQCASGQCGSPAVSMVPRLAIVTYGSGIWESRTEIPEDVVLALVQLSRKWVEVVLGRTEPGAPAIQSYSEMGYSETRAPLRQTKIGVGFAEQLLADTLRNYRVKRMVRGSKPQSAGIITGRSYAGPGFGGFGR